MNTDDTTFGPIADVAFSDGGAPRPEKENLELLLDIEVPISVEVGGTRMSLQEVLDLAAGSVVRLDKRADEPVDLRVNGKLVARGEVVMIDDCYGLRITKIVDARERLRSSLR